jgi:hypothetical protein
VKVFAQWHPHNLDDTLPTHLSPFPALAPNSENLSDGIN